MEKIDFKEVQKFRQPWLWLLIVPAVSGAFIYFGWGFNEQILNNKPIGDKPMSDTGFILVAAFSLLLMFGLTFLFYKMRLITEIRESGIYFRYLPMIMKFRKIGKEEIESYEVRQYKPIKEYGGYGIRFKISRYGKAYNVRGKTGLQLVLKNGEKILLGTQRKEAIRSAMQKLMRD